MKQFDESRSGTGTKEWAEVTENIQIGCSNNCLYCYAAHNANRYGLRKRSEWATESLTKRADIKSYPARDGVVMFPSTHDITPFNLERSEERRVGKECDELCRSRWSPYH
jgi:DNA repair photolyase